MHIRTLLCLINLCTLPVTESFLGIKANLVETKGHYLELILDQVQTYRMSLYTPLEVGNVVQGLFKQQCIEVSICTLLVFDTCRS